MPSAYASSDPQGSSGYTPPAAPGYRPPPVTTTRARIGVMIFTAFLVELVLIAAVGNPSVYDSLSRHADPPDTTWLHALANAGTIYGWRFVSGGGPLHLWYGQFAMIGTVFVVTALMVLAIGRGAITFGRAFFGTWMAVIVATAVGRSVGGLVFQGASTANVSRGIWAVFGPSASDGPTVAGSVGLGLVTGLITGMVAVVSRRTVGVYDDSFDSPAPYAPPPATLLPPPAGPPPWGTEPEPQPRPDYRTSELPTYDDRPIGGSERADTVAYPRYDGAAGAATAQTSQYGGGYGSAHAADTPTGAHSAGGGYDAPSHAAEETQRVPDAPPAEMPSTPAPDATTATQVQPTMAPADPSAPATDETEDGGNDAPPPPSYGPPPSYSPPTPSAPPPGYSPPTPSEPPLAGPSEGGYSTPSPYHPDPNAGP